MILYIFLKDDLFYLAFKKFFYFLDFFSYLTPQVLIKSSYPNWTKGE